MKDKAQKQGLRGGDWFGLGKRITSESWNDFLAARKRYWEEQDKKNNLPDKLTTGENKR